MFQFSYCRPLNIYNNIGSIVVIAKVTLRKNRNCLVYRPRTATWYAAATAAAAAVLVSLLVFAFLRFCRSRQPREINNSVG